MRVPARVVRTTMILILTAITSGCDRMHGSPLGIANQPPTVSLTGSVAGADGSTYLLRWSGTDPDGRVDHYLLTQDPRRIGIAAGWERAGETARVIGLGRVQPERNEAGARAFEPVFFAVRAVDDRGAISEPAVRAFFGENVAPTVQIISPRPRVILEPVVLLPPRFHIMWRGTDPDGAVPSHLAKYKFRLFERGAPEYSLALMDPDSLRRLVAPAFAGWDSVPGDTMQTLVDGLLVNRSYVFVLVGFDEAGDYSPAFSLSTNILQVSVGSASTLGPSITLTTGGLTAGYRALYHPDTTETVDFAASSGEPVRVSWSATARSGATVTAYRWAIDIVDVLDRSPRRGPRDISHWSRWSAAETTAVVAADSHSGASRRLFVEAVDSNDLPSRACLRVNFSRPRLDRPLLIVLDTRLAPEVIGAGGAVSLPANWPMVAELDSFLLARGGAPMIGYPAGAVSTPGLFAGYDADVFRTRQLTTLDKTVPLDLLLRYRNVVWITDANVVQVVPVGGAYSLVYMSSPGRQSTLVSYARAGGRVWLAGGGVAYAMSHSLFNSANNDQIAFTYSASTGELIAGRPMYDLAHWRSEFSTYTVPSASVARVAPSSDRPRPTGYTRLPASLTARMPGSDPLPPLRTLATFFPADRRETFEYLTQPNDILERNPGAGHGHGGTVLDVLYTVRGVYPPDRDLPFMTVYRGDECGQVVFMGADLWSRSRPQLLQLVDAVLMDLWHLEKVGTGRPVAVAGGRGGR